MKICLVDPNYILGLGNAEISLGLLTIATVIKQDKRFENNIEYLPKCDVSFDNFREAAKFYSESIFLLEAEVIMITTRIDYYLFVLYLSEYLREKGFAGKLILGGPQASHTAIETLQEWDCIDYIVVGEGEITILELLQALHQRSGVHNIKGVAYRLGNEIVQNEERERLPNLCIAPDYGLVSSLVKTLEQKYIRIEAGRGCKFRCSYCSTSVMWHKLDNIKTPKQIIKEMSDINECTGISKFVLEKDNLFINNSKANRFLMELAQYNVQHFEWKCSVRADCLSSEIAKLLKQAGCVEVYLGIETGSQKMQKIYRKNLNISRIIENILLLDENEIGFIASFICGHPDESDTDIEDTISLATFIRTLRNCRNVQFHKLVITPGSDMWRYGTYNLVLSNNMSDQVRNNMVLSAYDMDRIAENKNMFSAYYSLHVKDKAVNFVIEHIEKYGEIINYFPRSIQRMISLGISSLDACRYIIDNATEQLRDDKLFEVHKYEQRVYKMLCCDNGELSFSCFSIFNPVRSGMVWENCFVSVSKEGENMLIEVRIIH